MHVFFLISCFKVEVSSLQKEFAYLLFCQLNHATETVLKLKVKSYMS